MLELFIAFGAGLISFLSPCVLPLIPGYVSFITGSTLNEILEKKKIDLLPLIVFSLGFSFVFIVFGATASFLGQILLQNSQILRTIAGIIIIIFSLQLIQLLYTILTKCQGPNYFFSSKGIHVSGTTCTLRSSPSPCSPDVCLCRSLPHHSG